VPTYIKPLGVYNDVFYAGTRDKLPTLYYCNGSAENPDNWHIDSGFSAILNFSGPFGSIDSFVVYNGSMYVTSGGSIYSYDGIAWSHVATFDDTCAFLDAAVYNGKLYLATEDQPWRKPYYLGYSGFNGRIIEFDGTDWNTVLDYNYWIYSLEVYAGKLHAGTVNAILTYDGIEWKTSFSIEEGSYHVVSFIAFNNSIYAGTGNGYILVDPS
jgi:hypothetical protein